MQNQGMPIQNVTSQNIQTPNVNMNVNIAPQMMSPVVVPQFQNPMGINNQVVQPLVLQPNQLNGMESKNLNSANAGVI